jgi:hypothetical protein
VKRQLVNGMNHKTITASRRTVLGKAAQFGVVTMIPALAVTRTATVQADTLLTITADDVRVRDTAGLAAAITGEVSFGQQVWSMGEPVQTDGYWWVPMETESGVSGWVIDAFLDNGDRSQDYPIGTDLIVDRAELNLRDGARLQSIEIVPLERGELVTTTTEAVRRDGFTWYEVALPDGWIGYLAGEFLRPA